MLIAFLRINLIFLIVAILQVESTNKFPNHILLKSEASMGKVKRPDSFFFQSL